MRYGLHDYMLDLAPFFAPDWFAKAFTALFGYPSLIITQCGIYFSAFLFLQFAFNTALGIYRTLNLRRLLNKNISLVAALGHGFFGTITKVMLSTDNDDSDDDSPGNQNKKLIDPLSKKEIKIPKKTENKLSLIPTLSKIKIPRSNPENENNPTTVTAIAPPYIPITLNEIPPPGYTKPPMTFFPKTTPFMHYPTVTVPNQDT